MKEYLTKMKDGSYKLIPSKMSDDDIEIPEGMNYAYRDEFNIHFTKLEMGYRDSIVIWQREPIDKNEQVLKEILEGNLPEFEFEDNVNQPSHYCSHPSGIECIEITRHHDFAIGNAIKYLWRAGLKDSANEIQDLEKAAWYIQEKINQLKKVNDNS